MIAAVTAVALDGMRAAAPAGVEVRAARRRAGAARSSCPPAATTWRRSRRRGRCRWSQTLSAGTDWIEPHLPPQATLCAARGARDIPVAEWVVGALLGALYGQFRAAHAADLGRRVRRASCTRGGC